MTANALFCPLDHQGILAVLGEDAERFLQGQVTCNLKYLSASASSLGARCTPKGRMLSSFRILQVAGGYLLAMDSEILATQLADLKKYAVFFKQCSLSDASADWQRIGLLAADAALASLGCSLPAEDGGASELDGTLLVRLDAGRAELWVPAAQAASLLERLQGAGLTRGSQNDWLLAQIRAGIGEVTAGTRELLIPQMLNLQSLGGVSFRKGCYTGQEIVARMQHLGKLKRRMYRAAMSGEVPAAGAELFSPVHGSSVGEVVLAASAGDGQVELLAVLQENAVEDGRIHLGSLEGPALRLLELPYTIDGARDIQR